MSSISLSEIHGVLLTYTELSIQRVMLQEEHPLEQLCISLPLGDNNSDTLTLQIFTAHDLLAPRQLQLNQGEVSNILYFFILLPPPEGFSFSNDMYKILGVFNQLLPIGSFEVDEENHIYYRYGLLLDEKWGDALFISEIVQCMAQIFPRIYAWLEQLLQTNPEDQGETLYHLKEEFQKLVTRFPRPKRERAFKKPHLLPHPPSPHALERPKDYFFPLGLATGMLMVFYTTVFAWTWMGVSLFLITGGFMGHLLYKSRIYQERLCRFKNQKKQLDFYWQLLEIERIKVQSQYCTLKKQKSEVNQLLSQFSIENINTPGDLVRSHYYTRHLKEFKEALAKRQLTLVHQKEEIYRRCEELYEEQKNLFNTMEPALSKSKVEWGEIKVCLSEYKMPPNPEAFLFDNLQQTLEFLDFKVDHRPGHEMVVYSAKKKHAVHMSYRTEWHCQNCPPNPQSWMIVFYFPFTFKIPASKLKDIATLITMSNRYLPLGTLVLDPHEQQAGLKYHFVRGQGDISSFLVIEIIELMAFFGVKMSTILADFLHDKKNLYEVLKDTEKEFQSLPKSP